MVRPPRGASGVRGANRNRILDALRQTGTLTQVELARSTGLSPATVSSLVRELVGDGWLTVAKSVHNGRQAHAIHIARDAGVVIGVDLAHRHLRVIVAAGNYEPLAQEEVLLTGERAMEEDLQRVTAVIDNLLKATRRTHEEVLAVGVGLPAPVDSTDEKVFSDRGLTGWGEPATMASIRERLGPRAHLENDANLALTAELMWGASRGKRDVAYVHIATGIGAGLLVGGRLIRGAAGMAGELGHNAVDDNGRLCSCGNRGCLDTIASTPAVLRVLSEWHGKSLTLPEVLVLHGEGDRSAHRVIEDAGRHVGTAIAQVCNLLNPEAIVLGGELASTGETLLSPVREEVRRKTMPGAASVEITTSTLGDWATARGALVHAGQQARVGSSPGDDVPATAAK